MYVHFVNRKRQPIENKKHGLCISKITSFVHPPLLETHRFPHEANGVFSHFIDWVPGAAPSGSGLYGTPHTLQLLQSSDHSTLVPGDTTRNLMLQ